MFKLLLLNGPNLNLLGSREPGHYGNSTLAEIEESLRKQAAQSKNQLDCLQSNHEGVLIDRIQQALHDQTDFILINPGALTHTSIGLRDALLAVDKPFIEIHLSNVHQREPFRHHSYLSDIASGIIVGLGVQGYSLALQAASHLLSTNNTQQQRKSP